jgi:hypothetical protein
VSRQEKPGPQYPQPNLIPRCMFRPCCGNIANCTGMPANPTPDRVVPNCRPVGDPTITIVAEQAYDNGQLVTHRIRLDAYALLQSSGSSYALERAMREALAQIGVKR